MAGNLVGDGTVQADSRLGALLRQLWASISRRRRWQFSGLFLLMICSAFAEMVTIGAVGPFLSVLVSPERLLSQRWMAGVTRVLEITDTHQMTLFVTVLFAVAAVLAGLLRLIVLQVTTRLSFATGIDLSLDLYRRTLHQPYAVHISRNSSEVVSAIVNKVGASIHTMIQSMNLASAGLLITAIGGSLFVVDPRVAGLSMLCLGLAYGAVSWFSRRRLLSNGRRIAVEQTRLLKALNEGLSGIRDVLLDGTQEQYCRIYRRADQALRTAQASNMVITGAPRFVIETAALVFIAILVFALSGQPGGILASLPALGALALGAQRILPALHQTYAAWSGIMGNRASVVELLSMMRQPLPESVDVNAVPLQFTESIELDRVRFRYDEGLPWVINGLSFKIRSGERIGVVGSTGSGKSTMMDLVMGLLQPVEGVLKVDGKPIDAARLRSWQMRVAHVPQSIFLADASVAENIAFGVPASEIDMAQVVRASEQAQIAKTIQALPSGYQTLVGERGVRLSGGQRQRIGIARALYKRSRVLVFDEATSALDNLTEQAVMQSIFALDRDLTVIMIAHRISTVRNCNRIFELDGGKLVAQGSYAEMMEKSSTFSRLVASLLP